MSSIEPGPQVLPDLVGKVVAGKYAVLRGLGAGAMGSIFEAENLSVGRRVALKVLNPSYAAQREALERFHREARAAAQIGHPNIIEVFDMGRTDEGLPFIVMERLEGEDLSVVLVRETCLPPRRAIDIVVQVLGALGAAHENGIVHRDLKPENIFLIQRGRRHDFVKVLDFGVAKFFGTRGDTPLRLTRDGTAVGTPAYMSPEQARGSSEIDQRSDLYSAGVLLYEMVSGRTPHEGKNYNQLIVSIASRDAPSLREVTSNASQALIEVVQRSLARDRTARFQTAAEFVTALAPFGQTLERELTRRPGQFQAPPVSRDQPTEQMPAARIAPKRRRAAWLVMVASLAVLGAFFLTREASSPTNARARDERGASGVAPPAEPIVDERSLPAGTEQAESRSVEPGAPSQGVPEATRISLEVESNAQRAQVLLDGVVLGRTPLSTLVERRPGAHVLRVEATGYVPQQRDVELDSPLRLVVDLPETLGEPTRKSPSRRSAAKVRRPGPRVKKRGLIFGQDQIYR